MGLFDRLLGRSEPPPPDLDRLFAVPDAALSLEAGLGYRPTGVGSVCFRPAEGGAFATAESDITALLDADDGPKIERVDDAHGFTWLVCRHEPSDVSGLVTDLHAVSSTLQDRGFGPSLLCSLVAFADPEGTPVGLVYLAKRGAFIPLLLAAATGATTRSNCRCGESSRRMCPWKRNWAAGSPYGARPDCEFLVRVNGCDHWVTLIHVGCRNRSRLCIP